ncbi:DUF2252 family protein [Rhodococcus sp. NPDC059968]|uniref:DUF2252 family protein n=1 Tax=Rhodococcus sp. NPDC059968 TaxID=3347017 RepID=UPI00366EBFEB
MHPQLLADTGRSCGYAPGRAHARTSNRVAITAHHGSDGDAGIAFTRFTEAYADLNARDHEAPRGAAADRQGAVQPLGVSERRAQDE